MKRLAIAAAAALALVGTAHAQQFLSTGKANAELGYTFLRIDGGGGVDVDNGAIRGILGYDFHPSIGGELMGMVGITDDDTNVTVLGVPTRVNVDLRHSYGLYAKPKYAFNDRFEVFARLGWARTKVETQASALGATRSASDSDDDFSWGLGLNYTFRQNARVGLDYMVYYDKGSTKIDGWTISVGYRF